MFQKGIKAVKFRLRGDEGVGPKACSRGEPRLLSLG